jgi:hypothetical protein
MYFNVTEQLLIRFLHSSDIREIWEEMETAYQLFVDSLKGCDLARRNLFYKFEAPKFFSAD